MATIKEVARRAGVSTATVSRVLNNQDIVSRDTRARVLKAIEELDYRPSRVARSLRSQRSQLIGLILSDIQNPFFTSVIRGVEDVAYQNGYSLILCNSDENPAREQMYLGIMLAEQVAGIILATTMSEGHDEELLCRKIPTVAIDRTVGNLKIDTVMVDNVHGAHEAVTHLLGLGHRRVGLIGGLEHVSTACERQEGYEQAHRDSGVAIDHTLIRHGDFKQESGYQIAANLLAQTDGPSALFVANNLMTLGALNAIHGLGLQIPGDIAVVGFDDMPWATALAPPLTVVAQPQHELGRCAAELLRRRLSGHVGEARQVRLQTRVIVRESCGALPTASI